MKGKVIINGQEIEIEINEEQLEQLKVKKKTGYERVDENEVYCIVNSDSTISFVEEDSVEYDVKQYNTANYYSDCAVAENNARADQLMRQLRRFAVENRKEEITWGAYTPSKYFIRFDYEKLEFSTGHCFYFIYPGIVYFDSEETVQAAIKQFKDELIWYFTEYKDSL